MTMRDFLRSARYNYYVSQIIVLISKPLYYLGKFLIKKISIKVKVNGRRIVFNGVDILFPKNIGININSKLYWLGEEGFEPLTSKVLSILLRESDVFFDIGSNFGFYSVLAQKINKNIEVLCFEPLPNIYQDNQLFHAINNVRKYKLFDCAISNQEGEVKMFVPESSAIKSEITSSSIEENFFYNLSYEKHSIIVKTKTLDSFIDTANGINGNRKVILKIDVEGHENSVLDGGHRFLTKVRPWIIIEIDKKEENVKNIFRQLDMLQYSAYAISQNGIFKVDSYGIVNFKGGRDFLLIPDGLAESSFLTIGDLEGTFSR